MGLMKKSILFSIAMLSMASTAMAQRMAPSMEVVGNDTICQIFVYSPGDKDGLHGAYLDEKQSCCLRLAEAYWRASCLTLPLCVGSFQLLRACSGGRSHGCLELCLQ